MEQARSGHDPQDFYPAISSPPAGFLTKLDPAGRATYSTYLWPTAEFTSSAANSTSPLAVDVSGEKGVFVTGLDFSGTASYQTWAALYRACGGPGTEGHAIPFVAKFDTSDSTGLPKVGSSLEGPPPVFLRCGYGGRDLVVRGDFVYALDDGFASGVETFPGGPPAPYEPKGIWMLRSDDGSPVGGAHSDLLGLSVAATPKGGPDTSVYVADRDSVRRLDENLGTVEHTYQPGAGITLGISVDRRGNLLVVGHGTKQEDISPTLDAYQPVNRGGPRDAFVMIFNRRGLKTYATWLGGSEYTRPPAPTDAKCRPYTQIGSSGESWRGNDRGTGIGVDSLGNFYVVGITTSYDFPTTEGAFQRERKTRCNDGAPIADSFFSDVFVTRFADAIPKVLGISPTEGFVCERTKVTITGTGFTDNMEIWFGNKRAGIAPVTHNPATGQESLTVLTPKPDVPGPVDVRVSTPGQNSSSTALANGFTYLPSAPPVLESVGPRGGSPLGGEAVTVRGNLACVNQVTFGDIPAKDFRLSDDRTSLVATSPAHDPGPVHIAINTEDKIPGLPKGVDADMFTFAPLITALDPPSGDTLGGTKVKITGKGFLRATRALAFGDTPGVFTVNSDTEIMTTSPPHTAGDVLVGIVTTENLRAVAQNTGADVFHYVDSKVGPLGGDGGTTGGGRDPQKGIVKPGTPGGAGTSAAPASHPAQVANAQPLGSAQPSAGGTQAQAPVFGASTSLSPGFAAAPGSVASQSSAVSSLAGTTTAPVAATASGFEKQPDPAARYAMKGRSSKAIGLAWIQIASLTLVACFVYFGRRSRFSHEGRESSNAAPAPQIA